MQKCLSRRRSTHHGAIQIQITFRVQLIQTFCNVMHLRTFFLVLTSIVEARVGKNSLPKSKAIFMHFLPITAIFFPQAEVSTFQAVRLDHHSIRCVHLAIVSSLEALMGAACHTYTSVGMVTYSLSLSVYARIMKDKLPNKESYKV